METPLRTLIIEDDASYAELLKEMLTEDRKSAFSVVHAGSIAAALQRLAEGGFDLVLLDLRLPDAQGATGCEAVHAAAPHLPIVVVSGSAEEETSVTGCLQKGAQDYLVKGEFDRRHLLHSVRYAVQRNKVEADYRAARTALVDANKSLVEKVRELDRLNAIMMGREERILEMKEEIRTLREQLMKSMRLAS